MIVVVDDTVFREHFDFGGAVVLRLNLEQLSVTLVLGGIHTIDLLHRDFLTIDKVIGFTILHTSLGYELELEDVVAPIYGVLHRSSVDEILLEGGCYDTGIVVDVECTRRSNPSDEVASLAFCFTVWLYFDIPVYVLLSYLNYLVFLKLKACAFLPLINNFLHLAHLNIVKLHHDAVCVKLDYSEFFHIGIEVVCEFQQEQLPCYTN